jgi:hypothetical protein
MTNPQLAHAVKMLEENWTRSSHDLPGRVYLTQEVLGYQFVLAGRGDGDERRYVSRFNQDLVSGDWTTREVAVEALAVELVKLLATNAAAGITGPAARGNDDKKVTVTLTLDFAGSDHEAEGVAWHDVITSDLEVVRDIMMCSGVGVSWTINESGANE